MTCYKPGMVEAEMKRNKIKQNETALGNFYTLQLLLYWLTLKEGSEDWLVEPGPYHIRHMRCI